MVSRRAGGLIQVENGILRLGQGYSDRFPLVWRNDLFSGLSNRIFAVEVRLAHENATAYGSLLPSVLQHSAEHGIQQATLSQSRILKIS